MHKSNIRLFVLFRLGLFLTASCSNVSGHSSAQFAGSDGGSVVSTDDLITRLNNPSQISANSLNKFKSSTFAARYKQLLALAQATKGLKIEGLEFGNLETLLKANKNLFSDLDMNYKNVGSFYEKNKIQLGGTITRDDLVNAVKQAHLALYSGEAKKHSNGVTNRRISGSASLALGSYRSSLTGPALALLLTDEMEQSNDQKKLNNGCTQKDADEFRHGIAHEKCESSTEGHHVMAKVVKNVGLTAAAYDGVELIGKGVGVKVAHSVIGAAATPVEVGITAAAGILEMVSLRYAHDENHYCKAASGGQVYYCDCAPEDDSRCHDIL